MSGDTRRGALTPRRRGLRLAALLAASLPLLLVPLRRERAAEISSDVANASPVLSRGVPAFASGGYPATNANDDNYATVWRSLAFPSGDHAQWIAYDLAGIPADRLARTVVAWYNDATSEYWQDERGTFYGQPRDYTLEGHPATGPTPPGDGWTTLVSVTGNTYSGRMHTLDLRGYAWLRLRVTATNGSGENHDVAIQLDVLDASTSLNAWLFLGDGITMEGARHANLVGSPWSGGNLSQLVGAALGGAQFPTIINGGIGYRTMAWAAAHIGDLLAPFAGQYVVVAYGTDDAIGDGPLKPDQVVAYYQNLLTVVDAIEARGMIAVVPPIPWGCATNGWLATNGATLNAYVDAHLWADRPRAQHGPDLYAFFQQHPDLLRDCIHPTYTAPPGQLSGYENYQRQWVEVILHLGAGSEIAPAPKPGFRHPQ